MNFAIISGSLDANSRSRRLAELVDELLSAAGHRSVSIDLRQSPLPQFDNDEALHDPRIRQMHIQIAESDGIFLASPVYNWSLGSAIKNLIELTGSTGIAGRQSAWFDKIVTFLCAGGLPHSYMAHSALAISLMLDFKCVINPYHVYATERDWSNASEPGEALRSRLEKTVAVKLELAEGLRSRSYRSSWEI